MTSRSPLLVLFAALSLAACGDRDPDVEPGTGTPTSSGEASAANGAGTPVTDEASEGAPEDGRPVTGGPVRLVAGDDGAPAEGASPIDPIAVTGDAPPGRVDDERPEEEATPAANEDALFDVDATLEDDATLDFDAAPNEDPTLDFDAAPNEDPTLDIDAAPNEDPTLDIDTRPTEDITLDGDADEGPILVPAVPGDRNAARVLDGLRLAVGRTLLDLNARLNGGVALSAQQEECLGAYDPAFGDPLFAIDCEQPLATEPVPLYVERAAFHATDACRADLAAAGTERCVIAYASVFTRTEFVQTPPERRPRPLPGSGVVVRYAIDGPVLEVASDAQAFTGAFSCRTDLATGTTLPSTVGDCDTALRDVATRLDELFADVR